MFSTNKHTDLLQLPHGVSDLVGELEVQDGVAGVERSWNGEETVRNVTQRQCGEQPRSSPYNEI